MPWSAVIHDIHGGTWVYRADAPQTFVRQRVHVRFVSGDAGGLGGRSPGGRSRGHGRRSGTLRRPSSGSANDAAWLVSSSLRQPVLVRGDGLRLLVLGYRAPAGTMPLDVFPEFAPPLVEIQTEAPGLSTEEVESLISVPLENALNGTPG